MKDIQQTMRAARRALVVTALLVAAGLAPLAAEDAEPFIQVIPRAEIGYVAVLKHLYQSGDDAGSTRFDYVRRAGRTSCSRTSGTPPTWCWPAGTG